MDENEKKTLEEALARYLEGEPEAEDGRLLADALGKDPSLAHEMTGLLAVDQLLRHNAQPHVDAFLDGLQTRLAAQEEGAAFVERLESAARARAPRPRVLPWLVAAAAVLVAVISWTRSSDTEPQSSGPAEGVAALLVDEAGTRYRSGGGPDHVRFSVGTYELLEGAAHLRLVSGVDLVVPAPARFTIDDPLSVRLASGRLRVIVPEQGRGFVVRTPSATFEDFGTEFGVGVDRESGNSELHVFQGRVDVKGTEGGARLASVTLGQSVSVARGAIRPAAPPAPGAYPTPDSIGALRWKNAQELRRRDRDLVFYYPFIRDPRDGALLKDHAESGAPVDGRIAGARWVTGRWTGKEALLFDREEDAVVLDVPGEFEAFTMAAWIKIERLDYELNAVFDSDGWERGDAHWQLNRHGQLLFGIFSGTSRSQSPRTEIPTGAWTHVSIVYDRTASRAVSYVNGEPDGIYRIDSSAVCAPGASRIGNWLKRPDYRHILKRGFSGRIDEMAMWRRALTREEILGLVEEGRPSVLWSAPTGRGTKR